MIPLITGPFVGEDAMGTSSCPIQAKANHTTRTQRGEEQVAILVGQVYGGPLVAFLDCRTSDEHPPGTPNPCPRRNTSVLVRLLLSPMAPCRTAPHLSAYSSPPLSTPATRRMFGKWLVVFGRRSHSPIKPPKRPLEVSEQAPFLPNPHVHVTASFAYFAA